MHLSLPLYGYGTVLALLHEISCQERYFMSRKKIIKNNKRERKNEWTERAWVRKENVQSVQEEWKTLSTIDVEPI